MKQLDVNKTVATKLKVANNFERQRKLMNYYASAALGSEERTKRITVNYNLLNGEVDDSEYNAAVNLMVEGQEVDLGYPQMFHFPLISKVVEAAMGEEILMPIPITVRDLGQGKEQASRRKRMELLQQYLVEAHIKPIEEEVAMQVKQELQAMQEQGQEITPEMMVGIQQQMQEQVQVMTPEDIKEYLETEFKSPEEQFGQGVVNKLTKLCNLKAKKTEAFEDVLAVSEVYYMPTIDQNYPRFRVLNPKHVHIVPSKASPYAQDAVAVIVQEDITIQEAFALDGEYFRVSDVKRLKTHTHAYGKNTKAVYTAADEQIILEAHRNPQFAEYMSTIDVHTQEGQNSYADLYASLSTPSETGLYLTRTYVTWRDMAFYKRIKRRDMKTGEISYHWGDDHYQLNPLIGDVSMRRVEKPEAWEGVMYGSGEDAVFVKVRPVAYQHKSLDQISDVQLPIFGGPLNTRKGNSVNKSPVDLGKVWNYEFDLLMAEYKLKQASNFGKVFAMFRELKPADIAWGEWMATIKHMKVMLLTGYKEEEPINPTLIQYLREIDMSTINEIGAIIQMLQFFQANTFESMGFSKERLGSINQYMTGQNAQENITASRAQTARLFQLADFHFLDAVNYLFNITRLALRDNPHFRKLFLDDVSDAIVMSDIEFADFSQMGIFLELSPGDIMKLREIQARTQEIIQNQMVDIDQLFQFLLAESPAELRNIGRSISAKRAKMDAQRAQQEEAKYKEMIQMQVQKEMRDFEAKVLLQKMKDDSTERNSWIAAERFARSNDINRDGVNDFYETTVRQIELEREKFNKEIELKWKELELKYEQKIGEKPAPISEKVSQEPVKHAEVVKEIKPPADVEDNQPPADLEVPPEERRAQEEAVAQAQQLEAQQNTGEEEQEGPPMM